MTRPSYIYIMTIFLAVAGALVDISTPSDSIRRRTDVKQEEEAEVGV